MEFTYPIAVAVIGSVGTLCLALWRIVQMRRRDTPFEVHEERLLNLRRRVDGLETALSRLTEQLITFLSEHRE